MPTSEAFRAVPGLPTPLCTPNATWGLEYREATAHRSSSRRGGIALFPPGTDSRQAARLIRYYRWIDFYGIRAFALALPPLLIALHGALALSALLTVAIGVLIDLAAFGAIALVLRRRLRSTAGVRFLVTDPQAPSPGLAVLAHTYSEAREHPVDAVHDEVLWAAAWDAAHAPHRAGES